MIALYKTSVYFSTDESCMMCHVHPHVENSWKLSKHVNNGSGVKTHCVACHLPPQTNTWKHYSAKAKLGMKDVWSYLTKDSADFNWETKSELEHAVKYIPNESCKECHQNLFPEGITDDGVTAHLYYDENEKKLDLQCISCHWMQDITIRTTITPRWLVYQDKIHPGHLRIPVCFLRNQLQLPLSPTM